MLKEIYMYKMFEHNRSLKHLYRYFKARLIVLYLLADIEFSHDINR